MKFNKENYKTQAEVLFELRISSTKWNLQTLTYLRLGRKQLQKKPNGSVYNYNRKPILNRKIHWRYKNGRVYYTSEGIEVLRQFFSKSKEIDNKP